MHLNNHLYGGVAKRLVAEKVRTQHGDSARVARDFATVTGAQAKSLVLVMVPLFAVGIAVLTAGRKRYAVDHIVFSLHFYTYLFVLLVGVVTLLAGVMHALPSGIAMQVFRANDDLLSVCLLIGTGAYLWFALRRVYDLGPVRAAVTAVAGGVLAFHVFVAYQVMLFFITMAAI